MAKTAKRFGRVYTPDFIVRLILDFGGYDNSSVLQKHVIDNSCGDGAFLTEIVRRYCKIFLAQNQNPGNLSRDLAQYIHGIEIDLEECQKCVSNLNKAVEQYGIKGIKWDILNADALKTSIFDRKMDFVFGNPPYVRVHNLEETYASVKKLKFSENGMTDLFLVFFEIGFNMLANRGTMCLITPSSWLGSLAGKNLRKYIAAKQNLSGVIDLEHFQPFEAATYTLISRFSNVEKFNHIDYYTFDPLKQDKVFQDSLSYEHILLGAAKEQTGCKFYFSRKEQLTRLHNIKTSNVCQYVSVKNGFATLADKVFIGEFSFSEGTIDILKASTGKWSKCIYRYDRNGNPIPEPEFKKHREAYKQLLQHKDKLSRGRDIENKSGWYLFGRTQALKDVARRKYAVNTIVKDLNSIKTEIVPEGAGVYSGLYILTEIEWETIQSLICSDDFLSYIKLLKNYKSGGYYTFASKDIELYLNYKLTEKYGQSRISGNDRELF